MGFRFTDFGFQVKGFGLKGLGFRIKGLGFQVYGLRVTVTGLGHARTCRKILLSGDPLRRWVAVRELRFWHYIEEILFLTTRPFYGD